MVAVGGWWFECVEELLLVVVVVCKVRYMLYVSYLVRTSGLESSEQGRWGQALQAETEHHYY
jgi:hypothetical protein